MDIEKALSEEFDIQPWQVRAVTELLDAGNTIPFIARYRKEAHGSIDDQRLREIALRLEYLRGLEKRRGEVEKALSEQGALTEEISERLSAAATLAQIEDIYRPWRPKRRTRASIARERGLEPLAKWMLETGGRGDLNA